MLGEEKYHAIPQRCVTHINRNLSQAAGGPILCPILGILYPPRSYVRATKPACYVLFTAPAGSLVRVLMVPVLHVVAKPGSENVNTKALWEMRDDTVACGFSLI